MVFSKKWLRNHLQFLLHFLIHIDVLMLCRKFEVIPTSIFQVMTIFKIGQNLKKSLYYSRYSKAAKVVAAILKWGESYLVTLPRY